MYVAWNFKYVKMISDIITKAKAVPLRATKAVGERTYSSYSFSTSTLEGVSSQRHAPAALTPGKGPRYPLERELGGPHSKSGHRDHRKNPPASAGDRT
jgi:hypothetical protein